MVGLTLRFLYNFVGWRDWGDTRRQPKGKTASLIFLVAKWNIYLNHVYKKVIVHVFSVDEL